MSLIVDVICLCFININWCIHTFEMSEVCKTCDLTSILSSTLKRKSFVENLNMKAQYRKVGDVGQEVEFRGTFSRLNSFKILSLNYLSLFYSSLFKSVSFLQAMAKPGQLSLIERVACREIRCYLYTGNKCNLPNINPLYLFIISVCGCRTDFKALPIT